MDSIEPIFISNGTYLVDTNVLVAAFDSTEQYHDDARTFLTELGIPLVIPISVLIEAWGLIVGSRKKRSQGWDMLAWATTPGNITLIHDSNSDLDEITEILAQEPLVDLVDAMLAFIANRISMICQINPPLTIATYDTADFLRMMSRDALNFQVYDLRSGETLSL